MWGRRFTPTVLAMMVIGSAAACSPAADQVEPTPVPSATSTEPEFGIDSGAEPPSELTVRDVSVGTGEVLEEPGTAVGVVYEGRGWTTGLPFGSWDAPPLQFTVGDGTVIAGFEQGLLGMAVGGRRQIVVPPDLAYPDSDLGPLSGDTLVFVVELVMVR